MIDRDTDIRDRKKQKRSNRTYEVIDWYTDTRHRKKTHAEPQIGNQLTYSQTDAASFFRITKK